MKRILAIAVVLGITLQTHTVYAVINGEPAIEKRFDAVGAIEVAGDGKVSCTATLISAKWIVTADHCIHATLGSEEEGSGEIVPPEGYEFRLGNDFQKPLYKVKLKRWVSGPQINEETSDVAFGELSTPVPVDKLGINVIPIRQQNWEAADFQAPYFHIGFGVTDAFSPEASPLTDKRQLAQLKVTSASGNALLQLFGTEERVRDYVTQFHPEALRAEELDAIIYHGVLPPSTVHAWDTRGRGDLTDLAFIQRPAGGWQDTCFGDSGGPLLREVDGRLFVVGVVSAGMNRVCEPMGTKFTTFGPEVLQLILNYGLL